MGADLGAASADLPLLFTTVTEAREVAFTYLGKLRRVHPFGLVHRRGHWYLVGPQAGEEAVRTFRVDRLESLRAGSRPQAFTRPAGFRAAAAVPDAPWEAGEEEIEVTVRFDPEVAWWAQRQLTPAATVVEEPGGSLLVRLPVASMGAFIGWMIGFEDAAEVLGPAEVRERLLAHVGEP